MIQNYVGGVDDDLEILVHCKGVHLGVLNQLGHGDDAPDWGEHLVGDVTRHQRHHLVVGVQARILEDVRDVATRQHRATLASEDHRLVLELNARDDCFVHLLLEWRFLVVPENDLRSFKLNCYGVVSKQLPD